ncbi:MAG TPA: hydrogenase formation protein HypD [Terriglobales bacterium]|nr:hydrogenase formation protein HypD [Terriglobales bacterium]
MKFIDEYRDAGVARRLLSEIAGTVQGHWVLMEICGGQTHTIMRYGLDELLPSNIELVHGPGCPVCVTPLETIDKALELAARPEVILVSYGDMLRVPGSTTDLFTVKARGGDVRIVYSPTEALKIARQNPERKVVFLAVGFETTAPANAMAAWQAKKERIGNFSLLVSHVLVPPAIRALLTSPDCRVNGFIAPGHVCTVMGYDEYETLVRDFRIPIVVGGFEPVDLLAAVLMLVRQLEKGEAKAENQYVRSVNFQGNLPAQRIMKEVFEIADQKWRGIGSIPASGLRLREEYGDYDASRLFGLSSMSVEEPAECISAQVLQGIKKPTDCPAFGMRCTPQNPLGAPMVSSEGACAAYYNYRRHAKQLPVASSRLPVDDSKSVSCFGNGDRTRERGT